jgi:riboflavin synthase
MFTGIVEEIGKIAKINPFSGSKKITISAKKIFDDLKIGDSIAINGVCQTVVEIQKNHFTVDAVNETLAKTTFNELKINQNVNLERAILPTTRMGGHFVQGHIDCVGKIFKINKLGSSTEFFISFPAAFQKYLAQTGSVAIDGISLTIAEIFDSNFKIAIIPHTLETTILSNYKIGTQINIEFDIIGKYVESLLNKGFSNLYNNKNQSNFLDKFINQPEI